MKCICITGAIQSDLEVVSNIFSQVGMQLPKKANRGDLIDIASWHEQAEIIDAEEAKPGHTLANPGRFMEQLAGDIFVANNKSDCWGWADVRSAKLLDFWVNFDPRLYFVCVYVSPQQMLANAMSSWAEIESVGAVMAAWQTHYQQLLRFHLRNPQRSLLVDVSECVKYPHLLIERCVEQWTLKIDVPVAAEPRSIEYDSLALYLAEQLCQDYPQAVSLQHELVATLSHLADVDQAANTTLLLPEHIIADYRDLKDRSVEQALLETTRCELEASVLKHDAQQKRIATLQSEIAALTTACEEQSSLAVERQAEIDRLTKKYDDALAGQIKRQKGVEQKNELVMLQLQQVQQELEAYLLKHESQQKQIDALQSEVVTLTAACDERDALITGRQAEIEQLKRKYGNATANYEQQKRDVEVRLKEAEQENELLLLQLHQVQEELERYFLQHQDIQKELQIAETRWQRMLRRNPDYFDFDYDSIEVMPVENKDNRTMIWCLKNLVVADRILSKIEFKTVMRQGVAGFVFFRQPDNVGVFARWPAGYENQDEFTLIPLDKDNLFHQFNDILTGFSTSDWELLNVLIRLLDRVVQQPQILTSSVGFNPEFLRSGLDELRTSIEKIPAMLRYDQVALKRELVNPNYERLWLRFDNLSFGNKRWSEFEFRLACSPIRSNDFGSYPKLEFPEETGRAPFEAWFIESYDDFGAKLELRFALPEAMDIDVWQRISEHDRDFLSALVARLPAILATLQNAGVDVKRPWEEWIEMSKEIQRVLAIRVAHLLKLAVSQTLTDLEESISDTIAIAAPVEPDVATTKMSKTA